MALFHIIFKTQTAGLNFKIQDNKRNKLQVICVRFRKLVAVNDTKSYKGMSTDMCILV